MVSPYDVANDGPWKSEAFDPGQIFDVQHDWKLGFHFGANNLAMLLWGRVLILCSQKLVRRNLKRNAKAPYVVDGNVLLTAFNGAQIGAVQACLVGKPLLRPATHCPQTPEVDRERVAQR